MALPPKRLSRTTSNGDTAFPWKLHKVLEESKWEGFTDVISWHTNNSFTIHSPKKFQERVMRRYFNQTQYKSFQRQLNIYGFTRVRVNGKPSGCYTHPLFIRGKPEECSFMIRTKVKNRGLRKDTPNKKGQKSPRNTKPMDSNFPRVISGANAMNVSNNSCNSSWDSSMDLMHNGGSMRNEVFQPTPTFRDHRFFNPLNTMPNYATNIGMVPCDIRPIQTVAVSPKRPLDSCGCCSNSASNRKASSPRSSIDMRDELTQNYKNAIAQDSSNKIHPIQYNAIEVDLEPITSGDGSMCYDDLAAAERSILSMLAKPDKLVKSDAAKPDKTRSNKR